MLSKRVMLGAFMANVVIAIMCGRDLGMSIELRNDLLVVLVCALVSAFFAGWYFARLLTQD